MKNLNLKLAVAQRGFYNNSIQPLIPDLWANESLAILEENMVASALVHRDFEPELAKYGDLVHTRRPGTFTAVRKNVNDNVTVQNATATDVIVPLNQHIHVSFLIRDGEESQSFKDLVETYMAPAMLAQAQIIDRIVMGQYPQFLANSYGGLGTMTTSNARQNILGVRQKMNQNKAYMDGRNMLLTPATETTFLNLDLFVQAQQVGDDGMALEEAYLGKKFGFDMYMCQNAAGVNPNAGLTTTTVNNAGGYAAGGTTVIAASASGMVTGNWIQIAGDDSPQQITAISTNTLTIAPGLRSAVANGAVITLQNSAAVNLVAGYPAGNVSTIAYDVLSPSGVQPQVGQLCSFGTDYVNQYVVVAVDTVNSVITLDRPLVLAAADDAVINFGPPGQYNLTFHKNAIALVVRPLAMPRTGVGALSAVVNHNDLSMRATITYDGNKQGHLVTLDMLCGIAVLDTNLGAVLLG